MPSYLKIFLHRDITHTSIEFKAELKLFYIKLLVFKVETLGDLKNLYLQQILKNFICHQVRYCDEFPF